MALKHCDGVPVHAGEKFQGAEGENLGRKSERYQVKLYRAVKKKNNNTKNLPAGQLSNTCLAMSVAESFGEKVKSCVFPLTRMRRRCTCHDHNNSSSFSDPPARRRKPHTSTFQGLVCLASTQRRTTPPPTTTSSDLSRREATLGGLWGDRHSTLMRFVQSRSPTLRWGRLLSARAHTEVSPCFRTPQLIWVGLKGGRSGWTEGGVGGSKHWPL